jgi:ADP-dependent NAD(P)H-hydrate dehydratase / NAD(P)H-hydrate epimerase
MVFWKMISVNLSHVKTIIKVVVYFISNFVKKPKEMKILPIEQVREADLFTIENEPIASTDLMERAATQLFKWIKKRTAEKQSFRIVVGPGNNGGDGLVLARLLAENGFKIVLQILRFTEKESPDFSVNLKRLKEQGLALIEEIRNADDFRSIDENEILIDGVFGSGLSKPILGFVAEVIEKINASEGLVLSIDMPSGLFADKSSKDSDGAIIRADYTLSFQFPKLAFLFPENDIYVGQWEVLPIGLSKEFIRKCKVSNYFMLEKETGIILKMRGRFSHKGTFGHGLLIAGSYGKMGAAVLAASAAMRSGAGLITAHVPRKGYAIMQISKPEVMVSIDPSPEIFTEVPDLAPYNAIAVGPGIGTEKQVQNALKLLIQNAGTPMLFDADAINILGENKTWIPFVPKGSIFTPHPKEFERLVGKAENDFERLEMQKRFSVKYGVFVVLKGAFTSITTPEGNSYFNSSGNPGMATGGSGDVLTGIILGLLAQGYGQLQACLLGVFLHGLAGDLAAKKLGVEALLAGDIIDFLPKAFKRVY